MTEPVKFSADPIDRPNWIQRLVRRISRNKLGAWVFSTLAPPVDRYILRISGGRTSATAMFAGYPLVTLITIGAKSNQPRATSLLAIPYADKLILIASNFGNSRHPAWYYNLLAHPDVEVRVHDRSKTYIAEPAIGEERQRLWDMAVEYNPGYAAYKRWAENREIPVVLLTPRSSP